MGFNSAFKGLKLLKPRERVLNNLNDPVLNVLRNLLYPRRERQSF